MKRIINWILLVGTVVSAVVALKLSALPVPSVMPDRWANFWISSAEEQQKYVLLYDIAVGFIMSTLFYFMKANVLEVYFFVAPLICIS